MPAFPGSAFRRSPHADCWLGPRKSRGGFLIPAPADYLRIWLAQALFQNLALDLSGLLAVCDLLHPSVIRVARAEASREGWRADFDGALAAAGGAIDSLDRGLPCQPAGSDACVTDFGG